MDLTKIKDMLINPLSDKVAELLSPRIAEMVTDILKNEILEAQKYRIDKESELKKLELEIENKKLALKEYELNYQNPLYCKIHRQFMKKTHHDNDMIEYKCLVEGCDSRFYHNYKEDRARVIFPGYTHQDIMNRK